MPEAGSQKKNLGGGGGQYIDWNTVQDVSCPLPLSLIIAVVGIWLLYADIRVLQCPKKGGVVHVYACPGPLLSVSVNYLCSGGEQQKTGLNLLPNQYKGL